MYVQTPITVFNRRLGVDRREVYFPTCIERASYQEMIGSSHSTDGSHAQALSYKLRIPMGAKIQGDRTYLPEAVYKLLDDQEASHHWTLQTGDYVVPAATFLAAPIDAKTAEGIGARSQLIVVKEYADNTRCGTPAVQHWRIGGE